jgi:hypothetical protein
MSDSKKHWTEMGRLKNAEWFKKSPAWEQEALIAAMEEDTRESAVKFRAVSTFIYTTAIYAVAGALWGMVFRSLFVVIVTVLVAMGAVVGALSGAVIARQKTPKHAAAMQAIAGAYPGGIGLMIAGAGLVAGLVRLVLFH